MGNLLPRCHIRRDRARNLQLVCYRFVIGLQTAKVHRIVSTEIPLKNEWIIGFWAALPKMGEIVSLGRRLANRRWTSFWCLNRRCYTTTAAAATTTTIDGVQDAVIVIVSICSSRWRCTLNEWDVTSLIFICWQKLASRVAYVGRKKCCDVAENIVNWPLIAFKWGH